MSANCVILLHQNIKIMVRKIITLTLAAAALVTASCGGKVEYADTVNGVYFWRGVYDPNNDEQEFLEHHNIRKMYMRFFDVEECDNCTTEKYAPMYKLELRSKLPDSVEIIPTVFITTSAIKDYMDYYQYLARRIYAMCDSYDITPKEIQFDCDWTTSTRERFFAFLKDVRTELEQYFPGIRLSSTIRLHQLQQTPPPVDAGVLMCYNTGDFKDFHTKNSIHKGRETLSEIPEKLQPAHFAGTADLRLDCEVQQRQKVFVSGQLCEVPF